MNAHAFVFNDENIEKLDQSVQELLEVADIETVQGQRDLALIDIIKHKRETTALK